MTGTKNNHRSVFYRNVYHNAYLSFISDFYIFYHIFSIFESRKSQRLGLRLMGSATYGPQAFAAF